MSAASAAGKGVAWPGTHSIHLAQESPARWIRYLSTEVGFAHEFPPHNISPLWPTGAILFEIPHPRMIDLTHVVLGLSEMYTEAGRGSVFDVYFPSAAD
jgi:hypothetical protein